MKTKITLMLLLISFFRVQAQETDSLWHSFRMELDEIIQGEKSKAFTIDYYYGSFLHNNVIRIVLNSPIEEKALEYMYKNYNRDSLPNIRDFVRDIIFNVARYSNNESVRKIAVKYNFDFFIYPEIYKFKLNDFDDHSKQKLLKQFTRQFTEEELSFFAESYVKYWMEYDKKVYDYMIADSIKKYKNKISYKEAKERIFQSKVSEYKEKIINDVPSTDILMDAALLNIQEAIPYLEEYANNEKYDDHYTKYAVCALAYIGVNGYAEKAIKYFEGDDDKGDTKLAAYINNQDVWYTYTQRLQSKKYYGNCPVAYRTIDDLVKVLKDFPQYYPPEPGWTISTRLLVPEGCDMSTQSTKVPIDEEAIKVVVDWMEVNKGKYELENPIERTF